MGILNTIENCIGKIDPSIIEGRVLYVELDGESYDKVDGEVLDHVINEQNVSDMGKGKVLHFNGYKVIMVPERSKTATGSFYVAFRTKIL